MSEEIAWAMTTSAGGKRRKFWATTAAANETEAVDSFAQTWTKVLIDVLQWYSPQEWDGLLCGINIYEGTFDFAAIRDFDLRQLLTGCSLKFDALEDRLQGDFASDGAFEVACREEESRYLGYLLAGWERVRHLPAAREVVGQAPLPFRAITDPERIAEPCFESLLTSPP